MSTDERSIAWYNQNAENYTNHVRNPDDSIYHSLYEKPAMYGLLPDLTSKAVLSLGCGSGEDCNYLRQQGASRTVGIDISEGLVGIAKKSYPECEFQVMDMEHLAFDDSSFDFTYSSLAIHYIEDWRQVFAETYRVLKPNSYFLFSCNHPVYSAMEVVKDDGDTRVRELSRTRTKHDDSVKVVGDYMSRKALIEDGADTMAVTTWHKSLGEISAEATGAGFMIANLVEPRPLSKMKEPSPTNYETLTRIPYFVIFRLWKPAEVTS
ncbi:MAG: class I SAM-dependent methyltransferase [Candidatus Saccharibacteria bacterium]